MADAVRKVHDYTTSVPDRPGEAFRVLQTFVCAEVDLLACVGTTRGRRAIIDIVPGDARRFVAAARRAGLEFQRKRVGFLIQGTDRTGALAEHLQRLAERRINVTAVDGLSAGAGRWGAIIWVAEAESARAGRVLRARGR
jgi:prephenate dehydratase